MAVFGRHLQKEKFGGKTDMIYLVEDDENIRELVVYTLKSQDLDAKGFEKPSFILRNWKRSFRL